MAYIPDEQIEQKADSFLTALGVDGDDRLDMLGLLARAKSHGFIRDYVEVLDSTMPNTEARFNPEEGIIYLAKTTSIGVARQEPRYRFAIAHELGHAISGHARPRNRSIVRREFEKTVTIRKDESEANRIAAALERDFDEITLVETPRRYEALAPLVRGKNRIALFKSEDFEKDHATYGAILFISVLHTIPNPNLRKHIIDVATKKLRPGGFIVVDVPQSETYYNRRKKKLRRYKDGFLLRWGHYFTFYKSFYSSELDAMFEKTGVLRLFKKIGYSKHLIRIWKKV